MVEGGHHTRNRPPTLGTTSVDFYHYPVTVWADSTPQPNTEVPAPTGGKHHTRTHPQSCRCPSSILCNWRLAFPIWCCNCCWRIQTTCQIPKNKKIATHIQHMWPQQTMQPKTGDIWNLICKVFLNVCFNAFHIYTFHVVPLTIT